MSLSPPRFKRAILKLSGEALREHGSTDNISPEIVERIASLLGNIPDDALVASPAGTMVLVDYLPTRTFELAVHGLDLARVLGVEPPSSLMPGVAASLELAGAIGARLPTAPELLLLLTGRSGLPGNLSVV